MRSAVNDGAPSSAAANLTSPHASRIHPLSLMGLLSFSLHLRIPPVSSFIRNDTILPYPLISIIGRS
ncbi:hypothetical protein H2248_007799 [Termitomyces sp. 'cryptogamus']|nr:hypothetical protein H2248_007799 [Termitomyces sp. 'cryptogamus']